MNSVDQGFPNFGPPAKSGLRSYFGNGEKIINLRKIWLFCRM